MKRLDGKLCAGLLLTAGIASAQTEEFEPPADRRPPGFDTIDQLTGDWWGARRSLEDAGVTLSAELVLEVTAVVDGGIDQDPSFRRLFTADAALDLERLAGVDGAAVFLQFLSVNGEEGGSLDAGDIQIFSNIESDRSLDVIYEAWCEQRLLDDRLRLKLGKLDANSEFAFVEAAGDFAHSSAGFSPTIVGFPSYPDPATSLSVFWEARRADGATLTFKYGLFDGSLAVDNVRTGSRGVSTFLDDDRSDDYFHIAEAEVVWTDLGGSEAWWKGGRLAVGAWLHTGEFARFGGEQDEDIMGLYATIEQQVWGLDRAEKRAGLYLFAQYGRADEHVSEVAHHVAAGAVLEGLLDARPNDSAGVYLSLADLSDVPAAGFDRDELALDVYYRLEVAPAVFVQPELQYIVNPSGNPAIENALIAGLRVGVSF